MEELVAVLTALRSLLRQYQPPFVPKIDDEAHYDLWSFRKVVIAGRKRKEVFFAALILHKTYVGFYFMPIYNEPDLLKTVFRPELLSLLKGKSCFHIKKLDPLVTVQIQAALKAGYERYMSNGWV